MSSESVARSIELHERVRAWVRAFVAGEPHHESFDMLACDLARYQASFVPGYQKLLKARGLDAASFVNAAQPPAVPTDAFKVARVSAFNESLTPTVFRTSGTTIGARGTHPFRDVATYDEASLAFGRQALMSGMPESTRVVVLGPSPEEAPDSSLTHMLALFAAHFGTRTARSPFFLEGDVFDVAALDEVVADATVAGAPVLLLATSFALVHFLDALADDPFRLPSASRIMQTGGFKGKSREVSAPALRRALAQTFSVDPSSIVSEYGMTELSSQFYEWTAHGGPHGIFVEPPWARVVPVDPDTLEPVDEGEVGIARIIDLANVDSAAFVLAADRVRRVPCDVAPNKLGFELLGRAPGAPPRGCSIAIDEILSGNP